MLFVAFIFSACSTSHVEKHPNAGPWRILCVGDSITAGYTDNPRWHVPFEFGYRAPLYGMLRNAGVPVQFVGDSPEPWNGIWKVPTNQPSPDLRLLDQDHHAGYGGKATAFVAQHIGSWLQTDKPDFILLMIGINDIRVGATNAPVEAETNLEAIVQTAASLRPETHIIVAQVTPYTRPTPAIIELNQFIRETLVPEFAARGANVTTVDQFSNFVSEPGDSQGDLSLYSNGYNHPNAEGYRRMAQTWFNEIQLLRSRQY